jgi:sigma-B regulation protein RsbU (phosphoserine phosphatase)
MVNTVAHADRARKVLPSEHQGMGGDMMTTDASLISAEQMKLVLDVARLLAVTPDLDTLLTRIAESATSLLCAERASIFLFDPKTDELWTKVALGTKEIRLPSNKGIVGHVFQSNTLLEVPRPYEDHRFNPEFDRKTGFVTRNLLTCPSRDMTRKPIGVLQVVNRIGGDFTDSDRMMVEMLADQAGVAIQRHYLHEDAKAADILKHEMELAQSVQRGMIPAQPPEIEGLSCAGWMLPASVTGGDSYDLWRMEDGRLGLFLGDASGHGIAPAIVVTQARTLVRSLAEVNCDPMWLLGRINARLAQDLEPGRFVTVFLACISPQGEVKWCSAGHGPMFLRSSGDAKFTLLEPLGPPVGVVPDLVCDCTMTTQLEPGGMLVVLSDGIFEARSPSGELFEVQRVLDLLDEDPQRTPTQVLMMLRQSVRAWQGKEEPVDDQSIVIVQHV